jgi:hypothetical protein
VRSLKHIGARPVSLPLLADDVVEFHAARLLLLLSLCGVSGRIDSLIKMTKLDFFVRYPDFFEAARAATAPPDAIATPDLKGSEGAVESAMVRHHYGPWDKRYYHLLAHLEAKRLVTVTKKGRSYQISLSNLGRERAKALAAQPSFAPLVERMHEVKKNFGGKSGTFLKNLIYQLFDAEVGRRPLGRVIRR